MDYLVSLERAIEYIENHLEQEILSENIANAAGYSLYHLTHIFTAVIGEPIGSYIQKRRLSNSCKKLLYSKKRIIDIAIESGFSSSEAFSRAFKSVHGISPFAYRKNNLELYIGSKKRLDREELQHLADGITLKPNFIILEKIMVAGISGETSTDYNILPELWNKMLKIGKQLQIPSNARGFGICETDTTKMRISKDGNITFKEFVGVEVDSFECLHNDLETKIIPGGRYAVFTHKGAVVNLRKTFDYIYGSWALFTKEVLDEREDFELYDKRFLGSDHADSQIDIYIPVK